MTIDELLSQFRKSHFAVYKFVEQCPDEHWTQTLPDGERTVAAVAMHIARGYDLQINVIARLAAGQLPPESLERLDETNARHARRDAQATREQAIALLNAAAYRMEFALGKLTPEQLTQPVATPGDDEATLAQVIEATVLGHPRGHLEELQAATTPDDAG